MIHSLVRYKISIGICNLVAGVFMSFGTHSMIFISVKIEMNLNSILFAYLFFIVIHIIVYNLFSAHVDETYPRHNMSSVCFSCRR